MVPFTGEPHVPRVTHSIEGRADVRDEFMRGVVSRSRGAFRAAPQRFRVFVRCLIRTKRIREAEARPNFHL